MKTRATFFSIALLCLLLNIQAATNTNDDFAGIQCPGDRYVDCDEELWDLSVYGNATYKDYSGTHDAGYPEVKKYLNSCGQGHIKRTWRVKIYDQWHSCSQYIYVGGGSSDYTIHWPEDLGLDGCNPTTHPDHIPNGRPTWTYAECAMLASSYRDTYFNFGSSSCKKIIREWTVMDWCTYDAVRNPLKGIFKNKQVIKITTEDIPALTCPDDVTVSSYNCQSAYVEVPPIELNSSTCGGDFSVKHNSIYAEKSGNNISGTYPMGTTKVNYSVKYGCGHQITCSVNITVKDNKAPTPYCRGDLTVALMGMDTDGDNRNDEGMVEIWAKDLDAGSYGSCGNDILYFSFSEDTADQVRIFTCDDVGKSDVFLYVTDKGGNQSFCSVHVSVQNNGANIINCSPENDQKNTEEGGETTQEEEQKPAPGIDSSLYISGLVVDQFDNPVSGLSIEVTDYKGQMIIDSVESTETIFYLDSVLVDGVWDIILHIDTLEIMVYDTTFLTSTLSIAPNENGAYMATNYFKSKEDYLVESVVQSLDQPYPTVTDLRRLYDHVTKVVPFDETFQYIAADLNLDGVLDFKDVSEMINLLSGSANSAIPYYRILHRELPESGEAALAMGDLPYYEIEGLEQSITDADFMVIFLGVLTIDENKLTRKNIQTRGQDWNHLVGLNPNQLKNELDKMWDDKSIHSDFSSYPNPATEILNVEWRTPKKGSIYLDLVDTEGRLVKQEKALGLEGANTVRFSLQDVAPGLYFLRMTSQDKSSTKKIIINR